MMVEQENQVVPEMKNLIGQCHIETNLMSDQNLWCLD